MEQILHAFGIDWRLIVIQVFNFTLLMGALWYFLYTPVLKLISDREEKIRKGVEDAEKAHDALKTADIEKTGILKEAHAEASLIVARGTHTAEVKAKALEDESAVKIAKQLGVAKEYAEELKAKALKESEGEIAKVALLGAEKILNEKLG
jgi:F-type H+-transporting ATPase subunit b